MGEYLLKQAESNLSISKCLPWNLFVIVDVASLPSGHLFSCRTEAPFRTAYCLTKESQVETSQTETINPKSNVLVCHFCSYVSASY